MAQQAVGIHHVRKDVTQLVDEIKDRGAIYQAHNILGHVKTFFNWAIERSIYGIETSPCDRIKPSRLIGPKHPRQRVLAISRSQRSGERAAYEHVPPKLNRWGSMGFTGRSG